MIGSILSIYRYRSMLWGLVQYDLRTRYKGSVLGFLWTFLNPLFLLIIYAVVFSTVMRVNLPHYPAVLFVSLLSWNMFSTGVQSATGVIIRQSGLVNKIYFPREVLPLSVVGGSLVNYLLSLIIMVPFLLLSNLPPNWYWLYFPVILFVETIMTVGFSLLFSALNVYFRDTEHMVGILMMAWFYVTPVVYTLTMVPSRFSKLFKLNPMTAVVESYQQIFYFHQPIRWKLFLYGTFFALLVLAVGWKVFDRLSRRFAEEV